MSLSMMPSSPIVNILYLILLKYSDAKLISTSPVVTIISASFEFTLSLNIQSENPTPIKEQLVKERAIAPPSKPFLICS